MSPVPAGYVRLQDGSVAVDTMVSTVLVTLDGLAKSFPGILALYELGKLARDPSHAIWEDREFNTLRDLGLVSGTRGAPHMHEVTRTIVKVAVVFVKETPCVVDPRASKQKEGE